VRQASRCLLRAAAMDCGRERHGVRGRWKDACPQAGQGLLARLAGVRFLRRRRREETAGAVGAARSAPWSWRRCPLRPPNFLVLDEPPTNLRLRQKEIVVTALSQYEGAMLFVPRPAFPAALSHSVLEREARRGFINSGGYYGVCGATGHERRAAGVRGAGARGSGRSPDEDRIEACACGRLAPQHRRPHS